MASTSTNNSAYGISVKENQALYDKYLSAYGDVLKGIQSVGNAQKTALTDFYAAKQGQADQSLVSRGLTNTTVQSSVDRGLTLDQAKAQNDLADKIAMTRANAGGQMAQGIHAFLGGWSKGQSQSQENMGMQGFSNGSVGSPAHLIPFGGGGGAGGFYGWGGLGANMGSGMGGGGGAYFGGGDIAGMQGDFGVPFMPSGQLDAGGGYDQFGVPSGMPAGYDESQYAWA